MQLTKLNKKVLLLTNVEKLMKGIATNTLDAPKNAFVDVHGKIIATFDQLTTVQGLLIAIATPFLHKVQQHLEKYCRLTKSKVEVTQYNEYYDCDDKYKLNADEYSIPQQHGKIIITKKEVPTTQSDEEFTQFRLEHNIPLQGVDYQHEMLLNISEEFVSFTKGCFLGQEVLARVHNLSKPPKKLVVKYEDACSAEEKQRMTSKVVELSTGRVRGFVFVENK